MPVGPESVDKLDDVVSLLCEAVIAATGKEYADFIRTKKGCVKIATHWSTSADFQSSCAKELFIKARCIDGKKWLPMIVASISDLGLRRTFTYQNPTELAQSIINFMPEEGRCSLVASTFISGKDASILIVTKRHLEWHLFGHRLPCHICGSFLKGIRGLRMHQVT
jgi:hypothetical protein